MCNSKLVFARSCGGKITAKRSRDAAIKKYYLSPNVCVNCGLNIEVKGKQKVCYVRIKKFCNRSCAAKFNNKHRKIGRKPRPNLQKCKYCGDKTSTKGSAVCDKCNPNKVNWDVVTLNELRHRYKNKANSYFHGRTRALSRRIYKKSDKPKECINCGYNIHYDVCHIRPIRDFPNTATLAEVNSINNLIALCVRCHWEFDHGVLILKLSGVEK